MYLTPAQRAAQALAAYCDWLGEAKRLRRMGDEAGYRFAMKHAADALSRSA